MMRIASTDIYLYVMLKLRFAFTVSLVRVTARHDAR